MKPSAIQLSIANRLKEAGLLAGQPEIPAICHTDGNMLALREKALADVGMCLIVMVPSITPADQAGLQDRLGLAVAVWENPGINHRTGPGIPCVDMAWDVWAALKEWTPREANRLSPDIEPELDRNVLSGDTDECVMNFFNFVGITQIQEVPNVIYSVAFSSTEFLSIGRE